MSLIVSPSTGWYMLFWQNWNTYIRWHGTPLSSSVFDAQLLLLYAFLIVWTLSHFMKSYIFGSFPGVLWSCRVNGQYGFRNWYVECASAHSGNSGFLSCPCFCWEQAGMQILYFEQAVLNTFICLWLQIILLCLDGIWDSVVKAIL